MKQKLLTICLAFFAVSQAWAYDAYIDGVYYNIAGDSAEVTYAAENSISYTGSVIIPDAIVHNNVTYRVTAIGQSAFAYCTDLTSVMLGDNIRRVGAFAFNHCTSLTWVIFGEKVATIDAFAFYNCAALPSLDLPASLDVIANSAFAGCVALMQVTIPKSVTWIGQGVWTGCSGIASLQVEADNTVYHSADNCIVHTASSELVAGCRNSTIPASVTTIGNEAFSGCTTLTQMIIPAHVTHIGAYAFAACDGLTSLIISNSVTQIGGSAFAGCSQIVSLNIPSKVETIGASAFAACSSLKTISIPITITHIGSGAFAGCTALERISMPAANATYHSINNCIVETATKELVVGCKRSVLPNDGTITRIGNEAFAGCAQLGSITLPDNVTFIGDYAFSGCSALEYIKLPQTVETIGVRGFADCVGLREIQVEATTPPTIASDVFEGISPTVPIVVPCMSLSAYQDSAAWKACANLTGTFDYTLQVASADAACGSVAIVQAPTCANNATAIVEATAKEGYVFSSWHDGNIENPRTVIVDEDMTYTATFIKKGEIPVTEVLLDTTTLLMVVGNAYRLTATILPLEASNKKVTWMSDNPQVAVVMDGWVIANGVGEANIVVTSEEGNHTDTCVVSVHETLTTIVDGGVFDNLILVHKVLEDGVLYIIRTNVETGVEEKYTIDGRRVW